MTSAHIRIPSETASTEHSKDDGAANTLASVLEAARMIFAYIGNDLLMSMGVNLAEAEGLCTMFCVAALLHDFTKVNSSFQAMLRSKPGNAERQPVRHEILAACLLTDQTSSVAGFRGCCPKTGFGLSSGLWRDTT